MTRDLGTKQRSTDTIGGLTLMGVRLYNPATGRFLTRDPVAGGNDNTYIYPADPINKLDLDGQWGVPRWVRKTAKKLWKNMYQIGAMFACGASISCGMAVGAGFAAHRYLKSSKKKSVKGFLGTTAGGAMTGTLKKAGKVSFNRLKLNMSATYRGGTSRVGKIKFTRPPKHKPTHKAPRSWKFWKW